QRAEPLGLDGSVMAENVGSPVVLHDEPKSLRVVEPLHGTSCHSMHFFRVFAADCRETAVAAAATRRLTRPAAEVQGNPQAARVDRSAYPGVHCPAGGLWMRGTMMEFPLTVHLLADRAARYFADVEVVSRQPDRGLHRTTWGSVIGRARSLAGALL